MKVRLPSPVLVPCGPAWMTRTGWIRCTGRSVLPSELLRAAMTAEGPAVDLDLTAEERSWLEAFAEGRSSGWVARQAHISERQLYRRLHSVYERLGVTNRSAAIAVLSRHS